MINPDGHCYAFDSRGNGYSRGEGVATLILKPLENALADGDHVHTVIVNSGINQDGKSPGSIMSPKGDAQRDLMQAVYAECALDAAETPYVEAHGTVRGHLFVELLLTSANRGPDAVGNPNWSVVSPYGHFTRRSLLTSEQGILKKYLRYIKSSTKVQHENPRSSSALSRPTWDISRQLQEWQAC